MPQQPCQIKLNNDEGVFRSQRYLGMWVSGKTGERYLIAKRETLRVLQRPHQRQGSIAGRDIDTVLGRS